MNNNKLKLTKKEKTIYFGETICQATFKTTNKQCTNKAYYKQNNQYLCGVHSNNRDRTTLPINPNKAINKLKEIEKQIEILKEVAKENRDNDLQGDIILSKMRMMQDVEYINGYMCIFPNFKHQNRQDGFGCAELSPKSIGPIEHGMPNLPSAKNLENYHQFSKFWDFEFDDNNKLRAKYLEKRKEGYLDETPHRHKYDRKTLKKYNKNINIPKCSIYYDKYGKEHRYNYLECRYFYCHFYELLAPQEPDFKKLQKYIKRGFNLNIVGYDAYPVDHKDKKSMVKDLWICYNDTSKPFGHELVLYTLLRIKKSANYPWNKYYKKNKEIYKNVIPQ
jgi:hypothetical protein